MVVTPNRYSGSSIDKDLSVNKAQFSLTIPCTGDPPTGMSPRAQARREEIDRGGL
jgi:hypothetical protein